MKKVMSVVLCALLFVSLAFPVFADEMSISLSGVPETVKLNETFDVTVTLANAALAKSAGITVTLPKGIECVSGDWLLSDQMLKEFVPETGLGVIAYKDATDLNGQIFKMTLKATKALDAAEISVAVELKNGTEVLGTATKAASVTAVCEHSYGAWETINEASCTDKGSRERVCAICGDVDTEEIELVPHTYDDWKVTKEASCTEKGSKERICSECGNTQTEEIPMTEHNGEWVVTKEASCTEKGSKECVCDDCGNTVTEEIPAKGHTFGEWAENKEKSTATEKVMERECSVCGEKETKIEKITPKQEKNPKTANDGTIIFVGILMAMSLIALPVLKSKKVK